MVEVNVRIALTRGTVARHPLFETKSAFKKADSNNGRGANDKIR